MKKVPANARLCVYSHRRGWRPIREGIESLSPRELQVLKLIAKGVCGKEVAVQLEISYKTFSTYRERVFDKLNLKSVPDLIHYALFHGLVENNFLPKSQPFGEERLSGGLLKRFR
jgi:DNA-binding CsgD family transcriptional regulator